MDLEVTLQRISRNCLRGQPVPADLRALWRAHLGGDADLLEAMELTLVDQLDRDLLAGYGEGTGAAASSVRAHRRMFEHIAFFALGMDGALLGYWLGPENRPVCHAPVVELDSEGAYALKGTSVAEYLLAFSDSPEDFAVVRDWLTAHGIPITARHHQDIQDRLKAFDNPEALSSRYQHEEQARETGGPVS
jgi:hypothetical protein